MIDHGERIVTIEDAAELQLQQPHVVRLETRPANLEGEGEITMRDLVKNALRMRPDRIILGEIRGEEAIDMLQAMNTGHDGSMGTIHANTPRDALTRLENMVGDVRRSSCRPRRCASRSSRAIHLIVQISRMRDGMRRITQVTEIIGMEGDVITTQDLFKFDFEGENADGSIAGRFECSRPAPAFHAARRVFRPRHARCWRRWDVVQPDRRGRDLHGRGRDRDRARACSSSPSCCGCRHRHRKRLARVGRKRLSGRLDIEDARLMLLRQKQEKNALVAVTEALAALHPAARHRAAARQHPSRRAGAGRSRPSC